VETDRAGSREARGHVALEHGARGSSTTLVVGAVASAADVELDSRRVAADRAAVPVILVDGCGDVVHVGVGAERFVDASRGLPASLATITTPSLRGDLAELLEELSRPGRAAATRTARIDRGGVARPVQLTARGLPGADGARALIRISFEELDPEPPGAADAELAHLIAAADVPLVFVDLDLRVTRTTPRAEELIGVTARDLGRPLALVAHALELDLGGLARAVLRDLEPVERDAVANGRHLLVRIRPYRALDGRVAGVVITLVDVTRLELAHRALRAGEAALRENERRFRLALRAAPIVMTNQDRELRYTWGYTLGGAIEFIGKTDAELFPPAEAERLGEIKRAVLATGVGQRVEIALTTAGRVRHYDLGVQPLREGRELVGVTTIAVDVTPSKEAELALREADRRKDQYIAMLAHELRSPLAPLRAAIDLQGLADDDLVRIGRARRVMDRQATQLVRLVDDLLDVSRVVQGKLHLRTHRTALRELVEVAVEATSELFTGGGHQLDVVVPPDLELECDHARISQVLVNLLSNAAKYTPPGGHVSLIATADDRETTVRVRDDGVGVAPEMLPRIFDLFAQARETYDQARGGLGIGLNLVRSLVELHGGRVEARSAGVGRGSEFVFRLPLTQDGGTMVTMTAQEGKVRAAKVVGGRRRVLVVDDNADVADTIGDVIDMLGHDVRVAPDGPQALAVAEAFRPDLVLLDIGMPGMDGCEVARRLRALPGGEAVVLVALTGWGQPQDVEMIMRAGFDQHLVKPAALATLREVLAKVRD
jgi:signal transduction histidine kinase